MALMHSVFPRYFHWNEELKALSLVNPQLMKVHIFFIALTLLLMGVLCLTSSSELIETNLGKKIALGLGVFWTVRLFIQFFGYSSDLWKGKKFEMAVRLFIWSIGPKI